MLPRLLQGPGTIVRDTHIMSPRLDKEGKALDRVDMVIHEQNPARAGCRLPERQRIFLPWLVQFYCRHARFSLWCQRRGGSVCRAEPCTLAIRGVPRLYRVPAVCLSNR